METRLERAFKELASREEQLDKSTRRWREMSHNSTKCQEQEKEKKKKKKTNLMMMGIEEKTGLPIPKPTLLYILSLFSYHGG